MHAITSNTWTHSGKFGYIKIFKVWVCFPKLKLFVGLIRVIESSILRGNSMCRDYNQNLHRHRKFYTDVVGVNNSSRVNWINNRPRPNKKLKDFN
jgi:hypothetical protein